MKLTQKKRHASVSHDSWISRYSSNCFFLFNSTRYQAAKLIQHLCDGLFQYSSGMQKMDPDHIIALATEVIPQLSCLIFCATKKNCENLAGMICKYLNKWVDL